MTAALNRRQMISLATTMLVGALVGHDVPSLGRDRPGESLNGLKALDGFDNLRALGRLCADLVPQGQQQLSNAAGFGAATDLQEQIKGFARKRQQDFLLGRTRIVEGWVLAEAECALCVLCAQA